MKGRLLNGCVIEAVPVRHPSAWRVEERNDVPHVIVRLLDHEGGRCTWTPAEARAFAAALNAAADEAEVKS